LRHTKKKNPKVQAPATHTGAKIAFVPLTGLPSVLHFLSALEVSAGNHQRR
jgi:hypothetical protein